MLLLLCSALCVVPLSACGTRSELVSGGDSSLVADGGALPESGAADAGDFEGGPTDAGSIDPLDGEVPPPGCDELADVLYLLSQSSELYTFDPETLRTERVGAVDCGVSLNSMAVSRDGQAYVSSQFGELFALDPRSAACRRLPFDTSQLVGGKYGMGFVATGGPTEEGLFIVEELDGAVRLSELDVASLALRPVGFFPPGTPAMELTGTGDGRLFGFHVASATHSAGLVAIDQRTAAILAEVPMEMSPDYWAFHFAHWNGHIYIFITLLGEAHATVLRFSLYDRSLVTVGAIEPVVVGAGVSTCAPL